MQANANEDLEMEIIMAVIQDDNGMEIEVTGTLQEIL